MQFRRSYHFLLHISFTSGISVVSSRKSLIPYKSECCLSRNDVLLQHRLEASVYLLYNEKRNGIKNRHEKPKLPLYNRFPSESIKDSLSNLYNTSKSRCATSRGSTKDPIRLNVRLLLLEFDDVFRDEGNLGEVERG